MTVSDPGAASSTRRRELDALLFEANVHGIVHLPDLSDDQLCVLSGGRWPLTDLQTWSAWAGLGPQARLARGEAALAQLHEKALVSEWSHDEQGWRVEVVPPLALLASARLHPSYAAFGAGLGPGAEVRAPRIFGIGASDSPEHLILVELVAGTRHGHRLMSPPRAARSVAEWAVAALTTDALGQRVTAVALTLVDPAGTTRSTPGVYAVRVASRGPHLDVDARLPTGERIARTGVDSVEIAAVMSRLLDSAAPATVGA